MAWNNTIHIEICAETQEILAAIQAVRIPSLLDRACAMNEGEERVRVRHAASANDNTPSKPGPRRRRHRRSRLRSREDLRRLGAFKRPGKAVPIAKSHTPQTTPNHSVLATENPSDTVAQTSSRKRGTAAWKETADEAKAWAFTHALLKRGPAWSFTMNLGPDQITRAANENAGFLSYFTGRIARELRKVLGRSPSFWAALELTRAWESRTFTAASS